MTIYVKIDMSFLIMYSLLNIFVTIFVGTIVALIFGRNSFRKDVYLVNIGFISEQIESPFEKINPNKIAIQLEGEEHWTYKQLNEKSRAYANQLKSMGVQKGDRVGILLYNCLEYFALYFASAKIGAIAVRLNFRLTTNELDYAINDSGVKVLAFHSSLTERIEPIRETIPVEHFICLEENDDEISDWALTWDVLDNGSTEYIEESIYLDDPVMLMYTSGTTGNPKGAIWTHNNTFWFSIMQVMKWRFTGEEVSLTTGPLYHVGAMEDIALPTLLVGGTVIITKSKGFSMERTLNNFVNNKVTDTFLFPFMIYEWLHLDNYDSFDLSNLKRIYTGGDSLLPWAIEKISEAYPHIELMQVYGLTEGTPIAASLDHKDIITKYHTVGKPMPMTEIKIMNETGNEAGPNEVGEILTRSPAVSKGYWGNPEETKKTFVNGWCKTGDLGMIDEDGFLIISGRKKDMIRSGGENIYAAELEDVFYRHEAIQEIAIIGIPDPQYIETVCAVIVKKEGYELTEEEVIEYSQQHLASYKKPRKVVFVNKLPRTPSGKVQKFILRDRYKNLMQDEPV